MPSTIHLQQVSSSLTCEIVSLHSLSESLAITSFIRELDYLKYSALLCLSYFITHKVIEVNQCYNVSECQFL